eukprot:GFYU01003804.1.p1 GENE.GFYU01003804.1~~GFYU01003804.1.p1  ORF type:complete len:428 (-),score=67.79 GFYU01003804.1:27-1310(-)
MSPAIMSDPDVHHPVARITQGDTLAGEPVSRKLNAKDHCDHGEVTGLRRQHVTLARDLCHYGGTDLFTDADADAEVTAAFSGEANLVDYNCGDSPVSDQSRRTSGDSEYDVSQLATCSWGMRLMGGGGGKTRPRQSSSTSSTSSRATITNFNSPYSSPLHLGGDRSRSNTLNTSPSPEVYRDSGAVINGSSIRLPTMSPLKDSIYDDINRVTPPFMQNREESPRKILEGEASPQGFVGLTAVTAVPELESIQSSSSLLFDDHRSDSLTADTTIDADLLNSESGDTKRSPLHSGSGSSRSRHNGCRNGRPDDSEYCAHRDCSNKQCDSCSVRTADSESEGDVQDDGDDIAERLAQSCDINLNDGANSLPESQGATYLTRSRRCPCGVRGECWNCSVQSVGAKSGYLNGSGFAPKSYKGHAVLFSMSPM